MDAGSLAVSALLLEEPANDAWSSQVETFKAWVDVAVLLEVQTQRKREAGDLDRDEEPTTTSSVRESWEGAEDETLDAGKQLRGLIKTWFDALPPPFRVMLGMHPHPELERRIHFHTTSRTTNDGLQRFGLVVQLVEIQQHLVNGVRREVPSGATLVVDVTGRLRYLVAAKPVSARQTELEAAARLGITTPLGWTVDDPTADPLAVDFQGMHEGRL
jgi:hypothetical protein